MKTIYESTIYHDDDESELKTGTQFPKGAPVIEIVLKHDKDENLAMFRATCDDEAFPIAKPPDGFDEIFVTLDPPEEGRKLLNRTEFWEHTTKMDAIANAVKIQLMLAKKVAGWLREAKPEEIADYYC